MSHDHAEATAASPADPDPRLIDDALWYLWAVRDVIDGPPGDATAQAEINRIAGELTNLARGCEQCRVDGESLACHYLNDMQAERERSLPAWRCGCGALYKRVTEWFTPGDSRDEVYHLGEDPPCGPLCAGASQPLGGEDCPHESCASILFPACVLGVMAGRVIRRKGKVKDTDKCPGCGTPFAHTLALRAPPQQPRS